MKKLLCILLVSALGGFGALWAVEKDTVLLKALWMLENAEIETVNLNTPIDEMGNTILHLAAREGLEGVVRLLLQAGAHLYVHNNDWQRPLDLAVQGHHLETALLLVHAMAATETLPGGEEMPKREPYIPSLQDCGLNLAVRTGYIELVQRLLNENAGAAFYQEPIADDIALPFEKSKTVDLFNTALHLAVRSRRERKTNANYVAIVKLLIDHRIDPNLLNEDLNSALVITVTNAPRIYEVEILKTLLEGGANPNLETGYYRDTALHIAAERGSINTVKILLEYHADPSIKNSKNHTPLHRAALYGKVEVLELLLRYQYDQNTLNGALKFALQGKRMNEETRTTAVELLLKHGAKPTASKNKPALSLIAELDYHARPLELLFDWYLSFEKQSEANTQGFEQDAVDPLMSQLIQGLNYHRLLRALNALLQHELGRTHCIPTLVNINDEMGIDAPEPSSLELAVRLLSTFVAQMTPSNEMEKNRQEAIGYDLAMLLASQQFMEAISDWELDLGDLSAETINQALLIAKKLIDMADYESQVSEETRARIVIILKMLNTFITEWKSSAPKKSSRSDRLSMENGGLADIEDLENENNEKKQEDDWEFTETEVPMDSSVFVGVEMSDGELMQEMERLAVQGSIHLKRQ